MREIVFDTETTGLDPGSGDRVVEIGCVELLNMVPTGECFHTYLNPEREMGQGAQRVHGLSTEFLADKPLFGEVAEDFLGFIGESQLVAHNAEFDMRFINAELGNIGMPKIPMSRAVDTLAIARAKFPGAQHSLDALCRRFGVDNSNRTYHGALLDAEILAEVYMELKGGRQVGMALSESGDEAEIDLAGDSGDRPRREFTASDEELARHQTFLATLKKPLWSA